MSDYKPNEVESIFEQQLHNIQAECDAILQLVEQCRKQGNNGQAWIYMCRKVEDLQEQHMHISWITGGLKHIIEHGKPELICGDG